MVAVSTYPDGTKLKNDHRLFQFHARSNSTYSATWKTGYPIRNQSFDLLINNGILNSVIPNKGCGTSKPEHCFDETFKFTNVNGLEVYQRFWSSIQSDFKELLYGEMEGGSFNNTYYVYYTQEVKMEEGELYYLLTGGNKAIVVKGSHKANLKSYESVLDRDWKAARDFAGSRKDDLVLKSQCSVCTTTHCQELCGGNCELQDSEDNYCCDNTWCDFNDGYLGDSCTPKDACWVSA